jgi:hypothetical protein
MWEKSSQWVLKLISKYVRRKWVNITPRYLPYICLLYIHVIINIYCIGYIYIAAIGIHGRMPIDYEYKLNYKYVFLS